MDRVQRATKAFTTVRDAINQTTHPQAYRAAHSKPLRFYEEHSTSEAIRILVEESK